MGAELNTGQMSAVEHRSGRLLITAGAGSGKTRTLAERFAAFVAEVEPEEAADRVGALLTITYTTKAAAELAERVRSVLRVNGLDRAAREVDGAWISTIHTFCSRVLRREALAAGLDPAFAVADDVTLAELTNAAFESATEVSLDRNDADLVRLLEVYGYGDVRAATVSLVAALRSRGLSPADIDFEDVVDVSEVRLKAEAFFRGAADELTAHAETSKTAASHARACEDLAFRVGEIDESLASHDVGEHLWRALVDYGAQNRTAKAIAEVVERVRATRSKLIDASASAVTRPLASGLAALAARYLVCYEEAKRDRSVLDFDDLIVLTARLFARRPDVAEAYRARFEAVMVDEFQDTDALQLALIESVGAPDLATVGDARQSIYSFRGADVAVYREHREHMRAEGAALVDLNDNYRSHADIIAFVNKTFGSEALFGERDNQLRAARAEPDPARVPQSEPRIEIAFVDTSDGAKRCDWLRAEASIVADRFAELREHGFEPADMVVLLRQYQDATPFAEELEQRGLPTTVVGGNRFYTLPVFAGLRALCAVIANPYDDRALLQWLLSEMGGLSGADVWTIAGSGDSPRTRPLFELLGEAQHAVGGCLGGRAAHLAECIERATRRAGDDGVAVAVMMAVREVGYDVVLAQQGVKGRLARANVMKFVDKAAQFERAGGAGAAAFLSALDAERAAGRYESPATSEGASGGSVTVMSVHAAKGLEFPVVAVPGLGRCAVSEQRGFWRLSHACGNPRLAVRLPASWVPRSDAQSRAATKTQLFKEVDRDGVDLQSEEAKRLLYVACTRAEDVLVLVGSEKIDKLCDTQRNTPLGWLVEAHGTVLADALARESESRVELADVQVRVDVRRDVAGCTAQAEGEATTVSAQTICSQPLPSEPGAPGGAAVRAPAPPGRVSYSDLALYERCTLRYWAERIGRMGSVRQPASHDAMRFGSALHVALQRAGAPSRDVPDGWVESIADAFGLAAEERARLEQAVVCYRASDIAGLVSDYPRCGIEHPFAIRIGQKAGPVLVGSIDVYARDSTSALIVDYKSGTGGTKDELAARYRLQAECYALAALREGVTSVAVRFVRPEVVDSHGAPEVIEFDFDATHQPSIERTILGIWERIGAEPYQPLTAWRDDVCGGCPASGSACSLTPGGRRRFRFAGHAAG